MKDLIDGERLCRARNEWCEPMCPGCAYVELVAESERLGLYNNPT